MTTIKSETFNFLSELSKNNNRDWFTVNKVWYEKSKDNVIDFANYLLGDLYNIDPLLSHTIGKNCVFRIYRDVRFSLDKTPYKTNFGIGFSQKGKSVSWPGYYIQIEPNNSFLAGGYWLPEKSHLEMIRQEIDYNGENLQAILSNTDFKKYFLQLDQDYKLKKSPKNYDIHHPNIHLLKLKSFTVTYPLPDEDLKNFKKIPTILEGLKQIKLLNHFLINAISQT